MYYPFEVPDSSLVAHCSPHDGLRKHNSRSPMRNGLPARQEGKQGNGEK